ncbi:hypothetical protein [Conchiformibius kuhniae]|uniref:Uncharacterized protein n=1 Tax=Conchiformibius kuhniae TaxID=211502 RepID=A0A8T9MVC0_9NEIS|nr:hypothetical protein [Conchiformibius kuhniae]UOP05219.1 hypothetical protein LVJ77_03050 [Conchiformibius kuhniae]
MENEKIEVGYRHIGSVADVDYYHKFILYTNKQGEQYTISGWTGKASPDKGLPLGYLTVKSGLETGDNGWKYNEENDDHIENQNTWYENNQNMLFSPQKQFRELIIEAPDLSQKWTEMVQNARSKNNIYPYDFLIQNSNTLADTILREANLPEPKLDDLWFGEHLAPGSGNTLNPNLIPRDPDPNKQKILDTISNIRLSENTNETNIDKTNNNNWTPENFAAFVQNATQSPQTSRLAERISQLDAAEQQLAQQQQAQQEQESQAQRIKPRSIG